MKSFFYNRVDSTNLEAKRKLKRDYDDKAFWIITDDQYAGKGYGKSQWESEPGSNFTGSLIFFPKGLPASQQFRLSKSVSLGIADFLELYLDNVKIKWPNDLYVKDKKIGGILIENEIIGDLISLSVMGVGVNINQSTFLSNAPNPVSLKQIIGVELELKEVIGLLSSSIENRLEQLTPLSMESLDKEYLCKLYRFNEFAPYKYHNQWLEGKIFGIGEFGELLIKDKKNIIHSFGFKEVEFILP